MRTGSPCNERRGSDLQLKPRNAPSSARDAEVLLRWRQTVRAPDAPGVDLDAMSEAKLERLHAGLVKLASIDDTVLAALVEHVLGGDELASSS